MEDIHTPTSASPTSASDSTPRRRRTMGMGIAAGALALAAIGGAFGISAANAAPLTASPTASHAAHGARKAHHPHGVFGTITAIIGNTWTIKTHAGTAVTVTVDGSTTYGKKGGTTTASDFSVGQRVAVAGSRTGDAVTATHIRAVPVHAHPAKASAAAGS